MALLTPETVPGYVSERMPNHFPADATLTAKEIAGGNLNYAFEVTDGTKSVFVKQAPDFIKVFGPEAKLHRERMALEVSVYRDFAEALGPDEATKFIPKIFHFDEENMAFIMEFLGELVLLDKVLVRPDFEGKSDVHTGMGYFMGKVHALTHSTKVGAERAAALTEKYSNPVLRDVQLQYVFTKCYNESDKGAAFKEDAGFMAAVESLKGIYMGGEASNCALCHGDLHPGSWMVNETTGTAKTIDPEFCIYGPPGLDVGSLLSGFALAGVYHKMSGNAAAVGHLADTTSRIWEAYAQSMAANGIPEEVTAQVGIDAVGFAMCEVARTALGFAGDRVWLKFEDAAKSSDAEDTALALAKKCMMGRGEGGVGFLAAAIRELA